MWNGSEIVDKIRGGNLAGIKDIRARRRDIAAITGSSVSLAKIPVALFENQKIRSLTFHRWLLGLASLMSINYSFGEVPEVHTAVDRRRVAMRD